MKIIYDIYDNTYTKYKSGIQRQFDRIGIQLSGKMNNTLQYTWVEFDTFPDAFEVFDQCFSSQIHIQRYVYNVKMIKNNIMTFSKTAYIEIFPYSFKSHEDNFFGYEKYFIIDKTGFYGCLQISCDTDICFGIYGFTYPEKKNYDISIEKYNSIGTKNSNLFSNLKLEINFSEKITTLHEYIFNGIKSKVLRKSSISDKTLEFDMILAITGQSNSQGAGAYYDFDNSADQIDDRIFGWNTVNHQWEVADLRTESTGAVWYGKVLRWQSPAFHFAKCYIKEHENAKIGIINVGLGGNSISRWVHFDPTHEHYHNSFILANDSWGGIPGDLYNIHVHNIKNALKLVVNTKIDCLMWHQGEQDGWERNDMNLSDFYEESLNTVIKQYRNEDFGFKEMPFIVGETSGGYVGYNKGWEARNIQLRALNYDADENTKCVYLSDLSTQIDKVHFSAETFRKMGKRYYECFKEITF